MKRVFTLLPYVWLLVLFLVPFLIVLKISLSDTAIAIPPYIPTLDLSEGWAGITGFFADLDFENFVFRVKCNPVINFPEIMGRRRIRRQGHGHGSSFRLTRP